MLKSGALVAFLLALISASLVQGEAIDSLPTIKELPDPFLMNDGSRVKTKQDWERRRAELRSMILKYEYGRPPNDPTSVTAKEISSGTDPATGATVTQLELRMGPDGKARTHLWLTIPAGKGPFPTIIKGDLTWGRVNPEVVAAIIKRGYLFAEFDRTDLAPDKKERQGGVWELYPDSDWGALAAWAWGFSRVTDYLVTRPDVDRDRIIFTGHSRGGKAALLAGALDDRAALTVPNGSGAGGAGCYRVQQPKSETLEIITKNFPHWFAPGFGNFTGHVEQLPFDQHEVRALVAPRALLTTDSLDDVWANPLGTQETYLAANQVYEFLGVTGRTGLHFRHGPHNHDPEDFAALLDFADKVLRGKQVERKFDTLPFPEAPRAFTWKAPATAN